jgi:hypothetical protein
MLYYYGKSLHVRPGFWKYSENVHMQLAQLDLTQEEEEQEKDISFFTGHLPSAESENVATLEFRHLRCPMDTDFDRCFVLTVPPSPKWLYLESFHYSPISFFLFVQQRPGNKFVVVHHNLQNKSYKGDVGTYSFPPDEPYHLPILKPFVSQRKSVVLGRKSVWGVTDGIQRHTSTSPLLSNPTPLQESLYYSIKVAIHRDNTVTIEFRIRNPQTLRPLTEKPQIVFFTRLTLTPCSAEQVTTASWHAQMRTIRRIVLLTIGYFWKALPELFQFLWYRHYLASFFPTDKQVMTKGDTCTCKKTTTVLSTMSKTNDSVDANDDGRRSSMFHLDENTLADIVAAPLVTMRRSGRNQLTTAALRETAQRRNSAATPRSSLYYILKKPHCET